MSDTSTQPTDDQAPPPEGQPAAPDPNDQGAQQPPGGWDLDTPADALPDDDEGAQLVKAFQDRHPDPEPEGEQEGQEGQEGEPSSQAPPEGEGEPPEGEPEGSQTPPPEPEPEPTPEPATWEYGGNTYAEDDIAQMSQLHQWFNSLDDNALQAINSVLDEQTVVVPRQTAERWAAWEAQQRGDVGPQGQPQQPYPQGQQPQPNPYLQQPPQSTTPGSPGTPGVPQAPPDPLAGMDLSTLDPELVRVVRLQQDQINQTQQALAQTQQQAQQANMTVAEQQAEQQRQAYLQGIDRAVQSFATENEYDPAATQALVQRAGQLQVLPGLMAQHRGDAEKAVREALEIAAYQDPNFRQHLIDRDQRQQQTAQTAAQQRQQKAGALSGGGGATGRPPVHREDPSVGADGKPLTREQRMAQEVAAHMNGSGQQGG